MATRKPKPSNKVRVKRWLNNQVLDPALDFQVARVTKVLTDRTRGSCRFVRAHVVVAEEGHPLAVEARICGRGEPKIRVYGIPPSRTPRRR